MSEHIQAVFEGFTELVVLDSPQKLHFSQVRESTESQALQTRFVSSFFT